MSLSATGQSPVPPSPPSPPPPPPPSLNAVTSLKDLLCSQAILLNRQELFKLLQDDGIEMTADERESYLPSNPQPKKKTRFISHATEHGAYFLPDIYQLAAVIYDRMDTHRTETFPHVPKPNSKSTTIHKIGRWIANKRIRYEQADIHNIGGEVGFMDWIESEEYANRTHYYVLAQSQAWEYFFHLYGPKGEQKAVTLDDKVRVAGIIFREDMRQYVPDMIGTSRASSVRAVLDAASSRKVYAMKRLHEHFIDKEVVIAIPTNWDTVENQLSVDEINGEGAFEQFGKFNPNNEARMALNWTPADVSAIFAKVLSEYNTAMEKYTKGTGGGSGSHALFAVWDEAQSEQHKNWKGRSVGWIAQYAGQMSMLYLGVVLMWDAEFGYIFHARKDPMPDDCMIDDEDLEGAIDEASENGDNNNNCFRTPRATSSGRRGGTSSSRKSSGSSRKGGIESVVSELQVGRESVQSTQGEILQMMKTATTGGSTTDGGSASYVNKIKDTLGVIKESKMDLKLLKQKKKRLAEEGVEMGDKKMKKLTKEIKKNKELICTLELTLDAQQKKLRTVTKSEMAAAKGDANNDLDDDDDDSDSDDDDVGGGDSDSDSSE